MGGVNDLTFPTRVLAATAVALLSRIATGAATAVGSAAPDRDKSTILVK
jgi:hypothetical protein